MHAHYLKVLAATCLALAAVTGAFVFAADPQGLFRYVGGASLAWQPSFAEGSRLEKSVAIAALQPRVLLLGSSRVQVALDPADATLPGPAYNAGLQGTNIRELAAVADYALRVAPPREVVWGLDFVNFTEIEDFGHDFENSLFARPRPWWFVPSLLSADGLLKGLAVAHDAAVGRRRVHSDRNGFLDKTGSRVDAHELFLKVTRRFALKPDHYARFTYTGARARELHGALRRLRAAGVTVRLFIGPVHCWQEEVMRQMGLERVYETWKRDLVQVAASADPSGPLPLWDFSGWSEVTAEPLPAAGAQMAGYWEPSHYKKEVGARVLKTLYSQGPAAAGFGTPLDAATLESVLADQRRGRERFAGRFPGYVREISAELAAARGSRPP